MPRFNPSAPPVTGGILRLTVQAVAQTQIYECILDYMATTAGVISGSTQAAFLTAWRAACETPLQNVLANSATIQNYFVAEVVTGTLPTLQLLGVAKVGLVASIELPGTVAVIISKFSALKGQHGRGRQYVMSVPVSFQSAADPNLITAAALGLYNTLGNAEIAPIAAGGLTFNMCVSTRPLPPNTLVTQAVPVNAIVTRPIMGNVRRRLEGRGI